MNCWKHYIDGILHDKIIDDAVIVGLCDNETVWAAKEGGLLSAVSPQEVKLITGQDRKTFLLTGITIAWKKCSVIRDNLLVEGDNVMDVRSKGGDSRSICIGRTPIVLIIVMGKRGVHGGVLNLKVHDIIAGMKL
ncbi:profilin-3 [Numida meleagris]|uniref:profilin-3 n=1 Tax=Numida meleagris TaxID=8996 RepID=UPI000B3D9885|nr:profilin-3 [Numida meleagris]